MDRVLLRYISHSSSGYCPLPGIVSEKERIWLFSIKYYYLTKKEELSFTAQASGQFHKDFAGLQVRQGTSLVFLAFAGTQVAEEDPNKYRASPWRLLILSCQGQSSAQFDDFQSGVEAYLWCINHQLEVARRMLRGVAEQITAIACPSVGHR